MKQAAALLAFCVSMPAFAQQLPVYDASQFGKIVVTLGQTVTDQPQYEAMIGNQNIEAMSGINPESRIAKIGRAVGKLDILTDTGGYAPCTAFLIDDNRLVTNYHCVPGVLSHPQVGGNTIVALQFHAGFTRDAVASDATTFHVSPTPLETNEELDYAVLKVIGDANSKFGALVLSDRAPSDADPFFIIGHPMGWAQRLSREQCQAHTPAVNGNRVHHTCDTLPGSSGSPVLSDDDRQVIALHSAAAGSINLAVPMSEILAQSEILVASISSTTTDEGSAAIALLEAERNELAKELAALKAERDNLAAKAKAERERIEKERIRAEKERLALEEERANAAKRATSELATGNLVISASIWTPSQRKAFEQVVAKFKKANPGVKVDFKATDREEYKSSIRALLTAGTGPDVGFWFAGAQMSEFVEEGLFADISDVWADNGLANKMASTMPPVSFDGKQYGLPYTYYQWGLYVRRDIMKAHGINKFETYDELIAACTTLRRAGIAPVTIGTKYLWTAGAWFDYINMRTNGVAFHNDLMLGKAKYTDKRVVATFENWKRAIDAGCFVDNHQNYTWADAQQPLIDGEAASYLMGNFLVQGLSEKTSTQMEYWQFPDIVPGMPRGEDAPTDLVFVPANAANPDNGKKFLAFLSQADNLTAINEALQQLPPHSDAFPPNDPFLKDGAKVLENSLTAQFYDRDTLREMSSAGMEGFQKFMLNPRDMMKILNELERKRQKVFGNAN